jgi:hypothetical protein
VNAYLWSGAALLLGLVPLLVVCMRARPLDALPAVELAGSIAALVLLLLAEGFQRPALHTGVVGDYVAWLVFGTAALGGLVTLAVR